MLTLLTFSLLKKSVFLNYCRFLCSHPLPCFQMQPFKIHCPFINLLRVYVSLLIICSLVRADFQLRGSLDNRCAAALQTLTTLIDSELFGYCEVQHTTNQISHIICQRVYCFLPQWICHSVTKFTPVCCLSLWSIGSNNKPTTWSLLQFAHLSQFGMSPPFPF